MNQGEKTPGCSNSPGATHFQGCACHESTWAEKLAAAEEKGMAWERACEMAVIERDSARKAAQTYHDKLAAAGARIRELEEAALEVWNSIPATFDQLHPTVRRHAAALNALGALLAPPPEAEKRGEG